MRTGLKRSSIVFSRALELIGGIATAVLGVAIFLRIHSIGVAAGTSSDFRSNMFVILMFIAPALVVLVGSYLQGRYDKQWAFVLVFIGGIYNLSFLAGAGRFIFGYIGDSRGQFAVWTDLVILIVTLALAVINLIAYSIFIRGTKKINNPVNNN